MNMFFKVAWLVIGIAVLLAAVSIGLMVYYGPEDLRKRVPAPGSVVIVGGTTADLKFPHPIEVEKIKDALEKAGWSSPRVVTRDLPPQQVSVRISERGKDPNELAEKIVQILAKAMPENPPTLIGSDFCFMGKQDEQGDICRVGEQ